MKARRIVVGLGPAPQSRAALEAAAALARLLDAELDALFVESEALLRLAGLPFAREVGASSASARPLDAAAVERAMRAQAAEARRLLAGVADPRAVRWTLRVTRGVEGEQLRAASSGADLAVASVTRWGPEALALAQGAPTTLLVVPRTGRFTGPLAAVCPVAIDPAQAVALLRSLSSAVGGGLTLLVTGEDLAAAGHWCEAAGAALDAAGLRAQLEIVRESQPEALQAAIERLAPRAVAVLAPAAAPR